MSYCIMVKDLARPHAPDVKLLAVDIPGPSLAVGIVERIAASYPGNGERPASRRRWFEDGDGVHEIWAEPHGPIPLAPSPSVRGTGRARVGASRTHRPQGAQRAASSAAGE